MTRSFQAPERIGAREQELAEQQAAAPEPKGTTDHDGDGKMGGVKGRKPKAKRGKS